MNWPPLCHKFCPVREGTEDGDGSGGRYPDNNHYSPFVNLSQVTMVPTIIKWPSESSHWKKIKYHLRGARLDLPQKADDSNTKNSAPVLGLRIHGQGLITSLSIHLRITQVIKETGGNMSMSLPYNKVLSKYSGTKGFGQQEPQSTSLAKHRPQVPHKGSILTSPAGSES